MYPLTWFFLVVPFFINGQIYEIKYAEPLRSLSEEGKTAFQINATLYVEQSKSLFIIHSTEGYQELNEDSWQFNTVLPTEDRWYYKDYTSKNLLAYELTPLYNKYWMEDELHPMQWKIEEDKRTIGGLECQKAVCDFRGRSYEAWFTLDIPIGNGPWKLGGLPGLILEAFDKEKRVVFLFQSIRQVKEADFKIEIPETRDAKKVSFKDFLQYANVDMDKFLKNFEAKYKRSVQANGGTGTVKVNKIDPIEIIE